MCAILFSPGAGQRPEDEEEEEDDLALLAAFSESIVGVQYYAGEVNNKVRPLVRQESLRRPPRLSRVRVLAAPLAAAAGV